MKILVVLINSGNYVNKYFIRLIDRFNEINLVGKTGAIIKWTTLNEYLATDQNGYDVLIYNTFPDETHPIKFDKELTKKCDEKFNSFIGMKILLDTYDNGTRDGFARFNDLLFPRIKANPSYEMIEKMNLVISIPYIVYSVYCRPREDRSYSIVCAMRTKNMPFVRQNTFDKIKRFNPINERLKISQHAKRLCRTLINIVPTGNGDSSLSHIDTLAAGALLLAEENIANIKILPYADLKDGENFVSYNLDNICDKLDYLLNDRKKVDEIRMAGLKTFKTGYDITRNASQLLEWLNTNVK